MSGAPEPAPPAAPQPAKRRGILFWVLVATIPLVLCCGGVLWFALPKVAELSRIAQLPPAERDAAMAEMIERLEPETCASAETFLSHVSANRIDEAWALTSPAFRAQATRTEFDELVALVHDVMGAFQSKTLTNLQAKTGVPSTLVYSAQFEKGRGTIRVSVEKVGAALLIHTYRVESPLFMDAMKRGAAAPK